MTTWFFKLWEFDKFFTIEYSNCDRVFSFLENINALIVFAICRDINFEIGFNSFVYEFRKLFNSA